jgi:hypothetical protein
LEDLIKAPSLLAISVAVAAAAVEAKVPTLAVPFSTVVAAKETALRAETAKVRVLSAQDGDGSSM